MAQIASENGERFGDLRGFERDILAILKREGPTHGLGVMEHLAEVHEGQIHHGRLYPNLNGLVEDGFVEKSELDKRTNEYALTESGHAAVESNYEWLADCMEGQ